MANIKSLITNLCGLLSLFLCVPEPVKKEIKQVLGKLSGKCPFSAWLHWVLIECWDIVLVGWGGYALILEIYLFAMQHHPSFVDLETSCLRQCVELSLWTGYQPDYNTGHTSRCDFVPGNNPGGIILGVFVTVLSLPICAGLFGLLSNGIWMFEDGRYLAFTWDWRKSRKYRLLNALLEFICYYLLAIGVFYVLDYAKGNVTIFSFAKENACTVYMFFTGLWALRGKKGPAFNYHTEDFTHTRFDRSNFSDNNTSYILWHINEHLRGREITTVYDNSMLAVKDKEQ